MENKLLTSAALDVGILGIQLIFNTEETKKGDTLTSIDIINNSYINPEKLKINKIIGFDKEQGIKCFIHNSKRYIIGVCGVKHGTVFLINVDDKIYEEYVFVGSRDVTGDAKNIIIGDINHLAESRETFVELKFDYHTIQHDDVTFSFAMDEESDVKFQFKYSDFHPDGVCDEVGYVRIIRTVMKSIKSVGMSNYNTQFRFFDFADRNGYTATVSISHMLNHSEWTITTRDKDGNMCNTIGVNTAKVSNGNFTLNTGSFVFRGCGYIISVGGDKYNSIIVINLSSNEAYQYNFKDVQSINIDSIECDDWALGPIVKITGKLVKVKDHMYIHKRYRAIIDLAFGITSFVDSTELTPDSLDSNARKESIETAEVRCEVLKVKTLYDYTKHKEDDAEKPETVDIHRTTNNSITEDEKSGSGYNNDDEMEVLSVPENAFFKEFRELMDKVSSHVLSYEASLNMVPNDRIKICSFIDAINKVVEKYNK